MKKIILLIFLVVASGCGNNSGGSSSSVDDFFQGVWGVHNETNYFEFKGDKYTTYRLDSAYQCLLSDGSFMLESVTNNSFVLVVDGLKITRFYEFDGQELTLIGSEGFASKNYEWFGREATDLYPLCSNGGDWGELVVTIFLENLPGSVLLNKEGIRLEQSELLYELSIDINRSGDVDLGDFTLGLNYFKNSSVEEALKFSNLDAALWVNGRSGFARVSSIDLDVGDDFLRFSLPLSVHREMIKFSNSTPVKISTKYWVDESDFRADYYPDNESFLEGADSSLLEDVSGDVEEDYSFIDIKQVEITVVR